MGCCLSKKPSPIPLSSVTSCDVNKSPDPVKPDDVNKPTKPVIELPVKSVIKLQENPEAKPTSISEEVKKEEENGTSKKTDSEEASKPIVRTSSCTKEEVDAILIQCGKLSQSNSTRRYSGSKRSLDFDQNERTSEAGRKTPQRVSGSPRERRRRTTPSKESEVSKSYRSGSRERGSRSEATNRRGSLVYSTNIKFVRVPATDKSSNNNQDPSSKRVNVKRSIGEACRTAASPARAARSNVQPPLPSRKAEKSPYRRRTPLGEIDQNATKGDKMMMKKRQKDSAKPQVMSRSRSLRKSQDFETLLQSKEEDKSNYTALLLKDIKNFHGESHDDDDDDEDPLSLLPPCVTKACSIVEAVADLNSNNCLSSDLNRFTFTSDLMEPSFEKYVTVRRGCSLEEQ